MFPEILLVLLETTSMAAAFRERALSDRRGELLADFPDVEEHRIANTWKSAAAGIYRNWLLSLNAQKERGLHGKQIFRKSAYA